jgi:membrane-bound lytic murein transglycosylase
MKKIKWSTVLTICSSTVLFACSVNFLLPEKSSNRPQVTAQHVPDDEFKKQLAETNKVKCQAAKLDLLDAEAARDRAQINQLSQRLNKLCQF